MIDIHNLHDRAKRFVVGVVVKRMFEEKERTGNARPLTFLVLDELNKYAPREGWGPIKEVLLDIAERGRSLGIILIGAQQTASEVERRIVANSAIRVVGRLDAAEAERAGVRLPLANRASARRDPQARLDDARSSRRSRCRCRSASRSRRGRRESARSPTSSGDPFARVDAMRFLHTGDWHVGRTIRRRQRLDEARGGARRGRRDREERGGRCRAGLRGHRIETFAPSAEAERIVYDTLLALQRMPGSPCVLVAGNHDYARRLVAVERAARKQSTSTLSPSRGDLTRGA